MSLAVPASNRAAFSISGIARRSPERGDRNEGVAACLVQHIVLVGLSKGGIEAANTHSSS